MSNACNGRVSSTLRGSGREPGVSAPDGAQSTAEGQSSPCEACCPERPCTEISVAYLFASGRAAGEQDERKRKGAIDMPSMMQVLHLADNVRRRFIGHVTTAIALVNVARYVIGYYWRIALLHLYFLYKYLCTVYSSIYTYLL